MNSEWLELVLVILLGLITAVVCHYRIKNFLYAASATAMTSAVILLVWNQFYLGYFDPFAIFAFPGAVLIYFIMAAVVGIPFAIVRKRRGENIFVPQRGAKQ